MTTVADVDMTGWNRYAASPRLRGSDPFGLANFPDATTTGVPTGTVLTPSSGFDTSVDGQIIEDLDITGNTRVDVRHNNVIIRRCKITTTDFYAIEISNGVTGVLVEDCELSGGIAASVLTTGANTFRRINAHGSQEDAFKVAGDGNTIEDCWIHDFNIDYDADPYVHHDCIQMGNYSNCTFSGNRLDGPVNSATSAMILKSDWGAIDNINITNNRFSGGSFMLFIIPGNFGVPTNVTATGNVFERGSSLYGAIDIDPSPTSTWTNNTYHDGEVITDPF